MMYSLLISLCSRLIVAQSRNVGEIRMIFFDIKNSFFFTSSHDNTGSFMWSDVYTVDLLLLLCSSLHIFQNKKVEESGAIWLERGRFSDVVTFLQKVFLNTNKKVTTFFPSFPTCLQR